MGEIILSQDDHGFEKTDLRQLGRSDIYLSPLGLGTVKFGRNTHVKYPQHFDIPDDSALESLIEIAGCLGINLVDTAPAYGDSEQRLGQMLKPNRQDWIICTKVGERYHQGKSSYEFSAQATGLSIESSLRKLGTDYLDIVLIHLPDEDKHILQNTDVVDELIRIQKRGDIRLIGASTKTVAGGLLAVDLLDLVMITYSPQDTSQSVVLEEASRRGKGVIIKKALGSGHATNIRENLQFVTGNRCVCSTIVGTINPDHLRQNVKEVLSAPG